MASTIITKYGSGAPLASDLVRGELAVDTELGRLYTEDSLGAVVEIGLNPGGNLDVTGTVTADGLTVSGTTNTPTVFETSVAASYVQFKDSGTTVDNNNRIGSNGDELTLWSGGSKAVTIDASQRVGIGATSPATALDVVGTVTADGLTVDGAASISAASPNISLYETDTVDLNTRFRGQAGVLKLETTTDAAGLVATRMEVDHATGDISFYDGSANQGLFWDASEGSLGIGTASPAELLHIESGTNGEQVDIRFRGLTTSAGAGRSANIGFDPDPNDTGTATEAQLYLSADTTNKTLVATASGNVGIGTSPGVRLHVEGATDSNVMIVNNIGTAPNYIFDVRDDGVSKFRVDPFGNVHIGAGTASTANLSIITSGQAGGIQLNRNTSGQPTSGQSLGSYAFKGVDSANSNATAEAMIEAVAAETHSGSTAATNMIFYTKASGIGPGSSPTPRMTLDSSGNLLVGTPSVLTGNKHCFVDSSGDTTVAIQKSSGTAAHLPLAVWNTATTGDNLFVKFFTEGSATERGNIDYNRTGNQVRYNVTSDQRLKENIVDASSASDDIDAIKVRQFDWVENGYHQSYGLIAQELLTVAPDAVSQPEDPEEMMGVDYSKLVPMMLKEIQSLRARVAQLEGAN